MLKSVSSLPLQYDNFEFQNECLLTDCPGNRLQMGHNFIPMLQIRRQLQLESGMDVREDKFSFHYFSARTEV